MITLLYLATEEAGGVFGINSDLLGSNVINLAIVITFLFVYGSKFLNNILEQRREKIAQEIQEAEKSAQEAAKALAEAKENLDQAQAKAKQIKADAEETGKNLHAEILAQGEKEVERMKASAVQELDTERAKVIAELKRQIAILALEKAEQDLKDRLNDDVQGQLISRAIDQLGG
jgi:F-type H+-transporting ATPase subunit b